MSAQHWSSIRNISTPVGLGLLRSLAVYGVIKQRFYIVGSSQKKNIIQNESHVSYQWSQDLCVLVFGLIAWSTYNPKAIWLLLSHDVWGWILGSRMFLSLRSYLLFSLPSIRCFIALEKWAVSLAAFLRFSREHDGEPTWLRIVKSGRYKIFTEDFPCVNLSLYKVLMIASNFGGLRKSS